MSLFKFQAGDRFKVVDSNSSDFKLGGIVKAITFNSIHQDWEYVVKWDHLGQEHSHECVVADRTWGHEHFTENNNGIMNFGRLKDGACAHEWKMYRGFSEEYQYCLVCDKKKGS